MNRLLGTIDNIESEAGLSLVDVLVGNERLTAFVVDTSESCSYLKKGEKVQLLFKETEVALAKDFSGRLSVRNLFLCPIKDVKIGRLLAQIELDFHGEKVVSVISSRAARELDLAPGQQAWWLLKSNELSLMEA